MPEAQADIILPEYRVTLGAELFVTAHGPQEALELAMIEASDQLEADRGKSRRFNLDTALNSLFTVTTIEKMGDDDEDDDEDEDDAPDDMPRKPKRPAKMRK